MGRRSNAVVFAVVLLVASLTPVSAAGGPRATVTVPTLNVRQGPGTNYAVLDVVHAGDVLEVLGQSAAAGWHQVTLPNGGTGWISSSYVRVSGDPGGAPQAPLANGSAAANSQTGGHLIVFQTSNGGPIYAVSPNGADLKHLTTGMDPALSPDGRQVAFTRWDGVQNGITGSLWVINADGTGERQLMSGAKQPKSPSWSPDGKQIVVNMQQGGNLNDTYLCTVDGKPQTSPTPIPGARCRLQRADPFWGLRVVDAASGAVQDLPRDRHSFAPTWDPAHAWHVVYRGDRGLVNLDLNRQSTWPLKESGAQRGPVFSPDGTKIATTFRQNDHWEVHVMQADGSGEVRLTQTPQSVILDAHLKGQEAKAWNNAAPAWSPDGSQIAFLTDRNGSWEIWVMNADGSDQRPLVPASVTANLNLRYDGVDDRVITWR